MEVDRIIKTIQNNDGGKFCIFLFNIFFSVQRNLQMVY